MNSGKTTSLPQWILIREQVRDSKMSAVASYFMRFAIGLLPILCALATSNRAVATCGDYVHIRTGGSKTVANNFESSNSANSEGTNVPCPCRGPSCHQTPDRPIPVPTTPQTVTPSTTEAILYDADPDDRSNSEHADFTTSGKTQRFANVIFHPPRKHSISR